MLLPYDRYQRLLSGLLAKEVYLSTSEQEPPKQRVDDMAQVTENAMDNELVHPRASEALTQHFPKSIQNRLRNLLTNIQPHVLWNDKDEVAIEEKLIPGSNVPI